MTPETQCARDLVRSTFSEDIVTIAYDAALGIRKWVARYDGGAYDYPNALVVAPDGSKVFLTGSGYTGTSDDFATLAYDAGTGLGLWDARAGGAGGDSAYAIAVNPDGSAVYVTGYFTTSPDYKSDYATIAYVAS